MLAETARSGMLAINPIIYAEVSVRFERIEDLDEALPESYYRRTRRARRSHAADARRQEIPRLLPDAPSHCAVTRAEHS